jgi:hypothetical protein
MADRDQRAINPMADFAGMGKNGLEEAVKAQAAILQRFQYLNRRWLERWQAEVKLFSDFSATLTTARSMPEVAKAYQDLATGQWELATEDAKRVMADSEALASNGGQLFPNSWPVRSGGDAST